MGTFSHCQASDLPLLHRFKRYLKGSEGKASVLVWLFKVSVR